jgi:acetyl/propionyl-CoA carboxylase alpha subunit/acetyl-CoA carboxylase carboxyltransferase component
LSGLLVANRGEIAIRIARAARELGMRVVGICAIDDEASMHTVHMDECYTLPASGAVAYLDQEAVLSIARQSGCSHLHPGYGFLSENAEFAHRCAGEGIRFVGPSPTMLELFGDKIQARQLAMEAGIPVMPGTTHATSLEEALTFFQEHGAIMLKAMAGGGGRGMRVVRDLDELPAAYKSCRTEALQSFGRDDLYVEKLLPNARHIEVQVIGDTSGAVTHLWERDCSIQRRHQKIVEIAPAPNLDAKLREKILSSATELASRIDYNSLGTLEFLVRPDGFWFMEANPRLQVEHTITEEITGVDLVQAQIRIADGATLSELGLTDPPEPRGVAIQARINLETLQEDGTPVPQAGLLTGYNPPGGPRIRVDGYGYPGYQTSLRYDPLLAKVVARGSTFDQAAANAFAALGEFHIAGAETNLPLLMSILRHPAFLSGVFDTSLVPTHLPELLAGSLGYRSISLPGASSEGAGPAGNETAGLCLEEGEKSIQAPISGTVVSIFIEPGSHVEAGEGLFALEAMKMEHLVRAPFGGTVARLAVVTGETVRSSALLAVFRPDDATDAHKTSVAPEVYEDWSAEVDEICKRRELAYGLGGPEKVARQKKQGKLTARERIEALVDPESFSEIGVLTGFSTYNENGELTDLVPANFIAGTARISDRKIVLGVDDFTIRAGSGDAANYPKQIFSEQYARDMRLPIIRLMDGASGGGSVKVPLETGYHYLPVNTGWDVVVENMSLVPAVSACLGPTVGIGAARLVMSHLAVMVEGIGQVFTAGPPLVKGATREDLTKEELGGVDVHRENGMIERFVPTESEAFAVIRDFLSYLPQNVFQLPPVVPGSDPVDRREDQLLSVIPHNQRQPYDIQPVLEAVFDKGSVFPYAEYGESTVTALARLDGHPVGVITTDPFKGATMTAEGAAAITRLVDLCETFHLPIVSLTDQAGMAIGSLAERRGTIRYGARAIAAVYQARVPQAELILRRVFGVGGAGVVNRHRASRSWSWPSGTWGSLPPQGGVEAAFRSELNSAQDREQKIMQITKQLAQIESPFRTAECFSVQDVIDPRQSRPLLCDWVRDAYSVLPEQLGRPSFGMRP